ASQYVVELARLRLKRLGQPLEPGEQIAGDLAERGKVDGRGEDVVRGLADVDGVIGVDVLAGRCRDHLVRVHVRGRARAGLEDVDWELVVELAVRHPVGRG